MGATTGQCVSFVESVTPSSSCLSGGCCTLNSLPGPVKLVPSAAHRSEPNKPRGPGSKFFAWDGLKVGRDDGPNGGSWDSGFEPRPMHVAEADPGATVSRKRRQGSAREWGPYSVQCRPSTGPAFCVIGCASQLLQEDNHRLRWEPEFSSAHKETPAAWTADGGFLLRRGGQTPVVQQ